MKHLFILSNSTLFAGILILFFSAAGCNKDEISSSPWYPVTNGNGDTVYGVFESRIPCPDCERMKFGLALYKDSVTQTPTSFIMSRIYVGKGDDRTTNAGHLTIESGTQLDSTAIVYHLDTNSPEEFKFFWKVSEDILFILDENRMPRVGDSGYGYVLNRVN